MAAPVPPRWLSRDLALLDEHSGLPLDRPFSTHEAAECGVSRWYLGMLRSHALVRELVRGVYVAAQVPDSIELRIAALKLVVPDCTVVVDRTAAWVHGVDVLPRSAVHHPPDIDLFDRRSSARVRRDGVRSGERRLTRADVCEVGGVAVTTPLRTALDLGRSLRRYDALAALDAFLRVGVSREHLLMSVERFRGERGVVQLRGLAALADARAESPPESVLRGHWIDNGLPKPEPQCWVEDESGVPLFRVDLGLPSLRFGAEYLGAAFHGPHQHDRDRERIEWFRRHGWTLVEFRRHDVYGEDADPGARLAAGIRDARRGIGAWRPQGLYIHGWTA